MELCDTNIYLMETFVYRYCQGNILKLFHPFFIKNEDIYDHAARSAQHFQFYRLHVSDNVWARKHFKFPDKMENVPLKIDLTFRGGYFTCCNPFMINYSSYFDNISANTMHYKCIIHILDPIIWLHIFSLKGNNQMHRKLTILCLRIAGLNTECRRPHGRGRRKSLCSIISAIETPWQASQQDFFISTIWSLVKLLKVPDLILLWWYHHLRLHGLLCNHCYEDLALHWNHTLLKNHLQYLGSFTKTLLLFGPHTSLKTRSYRDTNFVVNDDKPGCRKDNLRALVTTELASWKLDFQWNNSRSCTVIKRKYFPLEIVVLWMLVWDYVCEQK